MWARFLLCSPRSPLLCPEMVGSQADVAEHRLERLASLDHAEELLISTCSPRLCRAGDIARLRRYLRLPHRRTP
jgi:hypothetical protein